MKASIQYLREILYLLGNDRRRLPALLLLFLGNSLIDLAGLGLIAPYIALVLSPAEALDGPLGSVVHSLGLPAEPDTLLIGVSVALLSVFLAKAVAAVGINYLIVRFSQQQMVRLRSFLMQAYQSLPYTEYVRRNSSEYVHAIQGLTGQFSGVIQALLKTSSDGLVAFVILGALAWTNGIALFLLVGFMGSVVLGYDRIFRRKLRGYGEQQNVGARLMVQGIHEGIEGLKEIRILGRERHFHRMVQEGAQTFAAYQRKNFVIQQSSAYLLEVALVAAVVALVLLTLFLGEGAEGLFATLGMLGLAALRLKPAAGSISSALTTLRFQRDAVQRLFQDLRQLEQMERVGTAGAVHTAAPFQTLELERVVFAYPRTKQPALREISLRIQAGESIGLIGPSGSGKTTLVDLLLGLLDPQEGQMRYNGMPLTEQVAEWRSQIAYLPQQVFLIDNTLRNNVALGENEAEIDDQRLTKALQQARLHELVEQLPHGVNTVLGERGVRLSGGQRQRVALARAFYHGRNILVMDEATSALDNETEQEIVSEIQRLKGQKTMIVIAHRLTTVQHCDRIYRLEQGRVVEQGTPEQVLRKVG